MEEVALKPLELVTDTRVLTPQKENFNYGLIKYGTPIYKSASTDMNGKNIYKVPEGKIFFLTSLTLSAINTSINNEKTFRIFSNNYGNLLQFALQRVVGGVEVTGTIQLSLIPPMLFYQGDIIQVYCPYSGVKIGEATGIITGYELDISMKDQFI